MKIERTEDREHDATRRFAAAMQHQLEHNRSKGDWSQLTGTEDNVWELLYHVFKLIAAMTDEEIDPIAIQEFAADVGNHSMFIADNAGALERVYEGEEPCLAKGYLGEAQLGDVTLAMIRTLKDQGILDENFSAPPVEQLNPSG